MAAKPSVTCSMLRPGVRDTCGIKHIPVCNLFRFSCGNKSFGYVAWFRFGKGSVRFCKQKSFSFRRKAVINKAGDRSVLVYELPGAVAMLSVKYIIDTNSPACFEYTGADSHAHGDACYHLKCEKCGRLIHLSCDEMGCMGSHLLTEHGFKLDPRRTVFYGLCSECM